MMPPPPSPPTVAPCCRMAAATLASPTGVRNTVAPAAAATSSIMRLVERLAAVLSPWPSCAIAHSTSVYSSPM